MDLIVDLPDAQAAMLAARGNADVAQTRSIEVVPQDIEITVFNEIETHGTPLSVPHQQGAVQIQAVGRNALQRRRPALFQELSS